MDRLNVRMELYFAKIPSLFIDCASRHLTPSIFGKFVVGLDKIRSDPIRSIMTTATTQTNTTDTSEKEQQQQQELEHLEQQQHAQESSRTSTKTFQKFMESVMIVSVAGFGGALAGLSLARQRRFPPGSSMNMNMNMNIKNMTTSSVKPSKAQIASHQEATTAKSAKSAKSSSSSRVSSLSDSNLPNQWALTCMGFATVLETVRWASPTLFFKHLYQHQVLQQQQQQQLQSKESPPLENNNNNNNNYDDDDHDVDEALSIIGDYMIGGAFAGAMFQGSPILNSNPNYNNHPMAIHNNSHGHVPPHLRRRRHHQQMKHIQNQPPVRRMLRGLGPGITLGLFAGCFQYGLIQAHQSMEDYVNVNFPQQLQQTQHQQSQTQTEIQQQQQHEHTQTQQ